MFNSLSITGPLLEMEKFNELLKELTIVDKKLKRIKSLFLVNRALNERITLRRSMTPEEDEAIA